jgi:hypothetical protein
MRSAIGAAVRSYSFERDLRPYFFKRDARPNFIECNARSCLKC